MLIPDAIHPSRSIYYVGAQVLRYLLDHNGKACLMDIHVSLHREHAFSFPLLLLALDWLYIIGAAERRGNIIMLNQCS